MSRIQAAAEGSPNLFQAATTIVRRVEASSLQLTGPQSDLPVAIGKALAGSKTPRVPSLAKHGVCDWRWAGMLLRIPTVDPSNSIETPVGHGQWATDPPMSKYPSALRFPMVAVPVCYRLALPKVRWACRLHSHIWLGKSFFRVPTLHCVATLSAGYKQKHYGDASLVSFRLSRRQGSMVRVKHANVVTIRGVHPFRLLQSESSRPILMTLDTPTCTVASSRMLPVDSTFRCAPHLPMVTRKFLHFPSHRSPSIPRRVQAPG